MSNRDGKDSCRRNKKSNAKVGDKCPNCTTLTKKPRSKIKFDADGHALPIGGRFNVACKLERCDCGCMAGVTRDDDDIKHNVFCPGCKWSNF